MKFLRYLLPAVTLTMGSALFAFDEGENDPSERDIDAVARYMQGKRLILVEDKGGDLSLSGQVRFEYQHKEEKIDNRKVRGSGSAPMSGDGASCMAFGTNEFDVEVNLYLDYRTEKTWASIQLEFDNKAGITSTCKNYTNYTDNSSVSSDTQTCGSGNCNNVCLEKAYFGYNLIEDGEARVDIELGRRSLFNAFDSKVQFASRFDGVLVKYSNTFEEVTDLYVQGALFVIDSVSDNYGWAAEAGFLNILDSGLDFKVSVIDWTKGRNRCGLTDKTSANPKANCLRVWNSLNSQYTLSYKLHPEFLDRDLKVYGAFLVNHKATARTSPSGAGKENIAWYVGAQLGKIKQEGDWVVTANYEYVQAQAVSDMDVNGIGTGNKKGFCYAAGPSSGDGAYLGKTNYWGVSVTALYAITDNITLDLEAEWSRTLDQVAAGGHKMQYNKYEAEFIYSF